MNYYQEAVKLIEANEELLVYKNPATQDQITQAEKRLNFKFPRYYRQFLLDYGTLIFHSLDVRGLNKMDIEMSFNPHDIVAQTERDKEEGYHLDYLLILYELGNGEKFALNYKNLNKQGEPRVTSFWPGAREEQSFEVLYDSFEEFFYDLVKFEIEDQINFD